MWAMEIEVVNPGKISNEALMTMEIKTGRYGGELVEWNSHILQKRRRWKFII